MLTVVKDNQKESTAEDKEIYLLTAMLTPPGAKKAFKHWVKHNDETNDFYFEGTMQDAITFADMAEAEKAVQYFKQRLLIDITIEKHQ